MQTILSTIKPVSNDTPKWQCKAWVNFDGTTNVGGFCTIRDSYNVTSVTDNGTGDYTINFTNAMSNANYSISGVVSSEGTAAGFIIDIPTNSSLTTSSLSFYVTNTNSNTKVDREYVSVQIFGS